MLRLVYKAQADDRIMYVASGAPMNERQADRVLEGALMRGCRDGWYPDLVDAATCPEKGESQQEGN